MLSRGASDASTRLTRSQSTTSVGKRRNEPPVLHPVDPETAHRHAMTAAHIAMDRAKQRSSAEIGRSVEFSRSQSNSASAGGGSRTRPQNIRFPDRRLPQQQPRIIQSSSYSQLSNLRAGTTINEFGITETYGSTPSSYRKLRKSKSLITPRRRGPNTQDLLPYSPGTPRSLRHVKSSLGTHSHGLRLGLKRSMSILKLRPGSRSDTFKKSHRTFECGSVAHGRAGEPFMDVVDRHQSPKEPVLSATQVKQENIVRRQSIRSIKRGEDDRDDAYLHPQYPSGSRLRSLSSSLRNRVKRVLGKATSKDNYLPAQQMQATRAHFRDYLDGADEQVGHEGYPTGSLRNASRTSLYVPSRHQEEGIGDLDAMSHFLRSMHSSDSLHSGSQSRITSWTNSTVANTVHDRCTPIERKRLSIIQEHGGPHQPSSSIGRHIDEVSATHLPLNSRHGHGQPASLVDSQRVYSALMKRIDQEQNRPDPAGLVPPKSAHGLGPEHNSNIQSFQTAPTIRPVISEGSVRTLSPGDYDCHSAQRVTGERSKTPQQILRQEENSEKQRSKEALQEIQSTFYPFSSENRPPAPSPFRLTLAARRRQNASSDDEDEGSVIIRQPDHGDLHHDTFLESRYSRTTSGHLPSSDPNSGESETEDGTGMATIVPVRVNPIPRPGRSLAQLKKTRANGTEDWKSLISPPLELNNTPSGKAHYREGAQIDGDDVSVGGLPSASGNRIFNSSVSITKAAETPSLQYGTPLANERFPMLDLKELPRNNIQRPKRATSLTRLASAAATDVKRAALAVAGVNDENARLTPSGGANPRFPGADSPLMRKASGEPVSTPGRLQVQQEVRGKKLAKTRSLMTIGGERTKNNTENHTAEKDDAPAPRSLMLSRLSRPFDLTGLALDDNFSTPKSNHTTHEPGRDTALPRIDGTVESKRADPKPGFSLGIANVPLSSKRMVSNFLRSRRKNSSRVTEEVADGEDRLAFI